LTLDTGRFVEKVAEARTAAIRLRLTEIDGSGGCLLRLKAGGRDGRSVGGGPRNRPG
jgi:hypothetical protein